MTYDLRAAVQEVIASTGLTDPGEIAEKVVDTIPPHHVRDALRQTMRAYVRSIQHLSRPTPPPTTQVGARPIHIPAPPPVRGSRPSHTPAVAVPTASGSGRAATLTGEPRRPNTSWQQQAIREGWQDGLNASYHVDGGHKMLRDMTYENLLFAAEERRKIADKNLAVARTLDSWARLMTEYNVTVFGDLPTEVLMVALGATR